MSEHRLTKLCPGTRVCCPKCGALLQHISARNGDFFAQCERPACWPTQEVNRADRGVVLTIAEVAEQDADEQAA